MTDRTTSQPRTTGSEQPAGADAGLRVLHVEDDADAAYLVNQLLGFQDMLRITEYARVSTRSDALAKIVDHGPFDVVLVDLHLPDSHDVNLVQEVLAHSPDSAVIVLTADDQIDLGVDALRHGAAEFLTKTHLDEDRLVREILFALERKAYDLRLRHLARTDELTGLPNRRALGDYYDVARATMRRDHSVLVLAYFDLNDFKPVNDLFGHLAGDEVLRSIGTKLRVGVRPNDIVCRLSGDEFVVAGMVADAAEAVGFGTRLAEVIGDEPIGIGDITVSAAVGIVTTEGYETLDRLLDRADRAMYAAKRAAR